nr:hypothetical protein [Tanacetum cinerariifolium]
MISLADKTIISGAGNHPPMLENDMYDSWKSIMELYMLNRQHGRMILESVENGPLLWPTVEENGVTRLNRYFKLSTTKAIQADCDGQHEYHANEVRLMYKRTSDPLALVAHHQMNKSPYRNHTTNINFNHMYQHSSLRSMEHRIILLRLIVPVFQKGDDPINAINHMMSILTAVVTSRYPPTNNQLRTWSNPRQQATINNGRGEGHMSKQCTKPKRKRDEVWFKDKVLLVQSQANGQVLHEEELEFLADSGIAETPSTQGKAIFNSPQPIYDQEPSMVAEDDETSKDKEIDKLMALISLSFKKIYKPTNNNLRTLSNTSRANQDNSPRINRSIGYENQRIGNVAEARETVGSTVVQKSRIQCYNGKEFGHVARECQKSKRVKDAAYHREKMLLCKQEEAGIQLNVSPDAADSGPTFDTEPVQKVSTDDHYNMFAIESKHPEQSESIHDTYPLEQDEHNVIIDSLDMSYDREQIDQNDNDVDLVNEREFLASLIEKLKCEIDERKIVINFWKHQTRF